MSSWGSKPLRSLLFTPGSDSHKLDRVGDFGSDAVVLDLEDAVAAEEKVRSRDLVKLAVPSAKAKAKTQLVLVRVNAIESHLMADDIAAVVTPGLDGLVIPKVQDKHTLHEVDQLVEKAEQKAGLAPGSVRLVATIETALGLCRCEEILLDAPDRVEKVAFGSGDFTVDIDVSFTREGNELLYARSRLVVASRAAGLGSPLDGPYLQITDNEGLRVDTRASRSLGFMGRVVVYPGQVSTVQDEYARMTPEVVASSQKIVTAFEEAEARGMASIRVDDCFVDYPIYYRAKEILRQSQTFEAQNSSGSETH